jgi:hypothetical protein
MGKDSIRDDYTIRRMAVFKRMRSQMKGERRSKKSHKIKG